MPFYAVRVGKQPGIYTSWDKAKVQIHKFAGAKYKKFSTKEEAEAFMNLVDERPTSYKNLTNEEKLDLAKSIEKQAEDISNQPNHYVLFCDGSNKEDHNKEMVYGWGYLILDESQIKFKGSGAGDNPDHAKLRNIAGELFSVIKGVRDIISKFGGNVHEITVFYDYTGIEDWFTGTWQTKSALAKSYVEQMNIMAKNHQIKFNFKHVKGHTNNKYNEEVDQLAFRAVTKLIEEKRGNQ